jgi:hypothetical protein
MTIHGGRMVTAALLSVMAWVGGCRPAVGQVIQGSVLDEDTGVPVPGVLVALYGPGAEQQAVALSDSTGFYRIVAPEPGSYHVVAEGLKLAVFRSHLLAIAAREEAYEMDLLVRRVPIPIRGI